MIQRLWAMLFGDGPSLVVAEDDGRVKALRQEQLELQLELGFEPDDGVQSWLRLHQLLKSHEDRITALEAGK